MLLWANVFKHTVYIKLASFPFRFTTPLTADTKRKTEIPPKPQNYHSKMLLSRICGVIFHHIIVLGKQRMYLQYKTTNKSPQQTSSCLT